MTLATEDPSIQGNRPSKHAQEGQNDPDGGEAPPATTDAAGPPEAATTSVGRLGRADSLRRAAQALLDARGNRGDSGRSSFSEMTGPITALRAALGPNTSNGKLHPRLETKQAQVLAMLARDEGVSGPQIAKAMGWAPHTVRGFLAGLAKKGIRVDVLERVRQVGPDKTGAKGSFTIYHIAGAPPALTNSWCPLLPQRTTAAIRN